MKTLVIGAAIIDIIMKIKRLPKSGEDILCSETVSAVGGCAYNVAGTLRGFGVDHDLFVPVGRGMYGDMIAGDLEKLGYQILIREEESDNGYCLCLVEEDGERTFITVKGAEGRFRHSWFEQLSQDAYDSIYVAGYQVCGTSGGVISDWMAGAKDRMKEKRVFFAPGPVITDIDQAVMERILSVGPILHLNEKEAFDYAKQPSVEDCLKYLYGLNHNLVVVTMGASGTMYYDGSVMRQVPAYKTQVKDTIGAGDSHVAAMIAGYSKGLDTEQCVRLANRVASAIVSIQGPVMTGEMFEQQDFAPYILNGCSKHTNVEG
ncbi:PfkB family carbohydrate kinase [Enterocloster bolteae]|uniref:PfkB family carbohydrate kinase n=1 Tax=Enterocloster bolteae TaxID=208479 RepID=UPI002A808CBA|nr:PfkB family carbohydrate kinase [Enterocloster bolteae]